MTAVPEIIERVARAICTAAMIDPDWCDEALSANGGKPMWQHKIALARAAIAAALAWQPMETAPKNGTEVPCLSRAYDGPVMLRWCAHNGFEAWRDWDNDIYEPTAWFDLPAPLSNTPMTQGAH